jgi:hypothetical protein
VTTRADLHAVIAADWQAYRAAVEQEPGRWWLRRRELPDGRVLFLQKLPHFYRVTVGPSQWPLFDSSYDFEADEPAWRAMLEWDGNGDPDGWFRNPQSGRRRPDGDVAREYVTD